MFNQGNILKENYLMLPAFYTEGPSDEDWTVSDWVSDVSTECMSSEFGRIELFGDELNKLTDELDQDASIERNETLYALADKVIDQMEGRSREDIEKWSDRLAEDLSKFND